MSMNLPSLIPQCDSILHALRNNSKRTVLSGLQGSGAACLVARLIPACPQGLLVIAADQERADEFIRELTFFSTSDNLPLPFPAWDSQPLAAASPHPDISGARLDALFRLQNGLSRAIIMPFSASLQRVMPRRTFSDASCYLITNEEFEREELLGKLLRLGYANVPLVEDRGTFAVRGGILDIFPPHLTSPVRIEFFGDTVETMRCFDPLTQRSLRAIEELVLLPSREVLLTEEILADIAPRLKACCDDLEIPANRRREILEELRNAVYFRGVELLQPLLHPGLETIFDYAPGAPVILLDSGAIQESMTLFRRELDEGVIKARLAGIPHSPVSEQYLDDASFWELLEQRPCLDVSGLVLEEAEQRELINVPCRTTSNLRVTVAKETTHALAPLSRTLRGWLDEGYQIAIACHQAAQADRLKELLSPLRHRVLNQ